MDETLSELGEFIELTLGDKVKGWSVAYGDLTLTCPMNRLSVFCVSCAMTRGVALWHWLIFAVWIGRLGKTF